MIGQTLAHYKILEKIGSGGMDSPPGPRHQARSLTAIRILPEAFWQDQEHLVHFEMDFDPAN
ncbi:MAG: hypothetical protein E2P02_23600 [Acidobacteria bacterium]|nr:MAG: hypothetical protein E2P02_23600 [Acidobacteriota bacterium]